MVYCKAATDISKPLLSHNKCFIKHFIVSKVPFIYDYYYYEVSLHFLYCHLLSIYLYSPQQNPVKFPVLFILWMEI